MFSIVFVWFLISFSHLQTWKTHLDNVHIIFFWFLLKLLMIDKELLNYIQIICHMSFHKIGYLDIQHALSESHIIWICHRLCQEIGERVRRKPLIQPEESVLDNWKQKTCCVVPIGNKKNNLKTILITCVVPVRSKENKMRMIKRCSSNRKQKK